MQRNVIPIMLENAPLFVCDMRNKNFLFSLDTTAVSCCKAYLENWKSTVLQVDPLVASWEQLEFIRTILPGEFLVHRLLL